MSSIIPFSFKSLPRNKKFVFLKFGKFFDLYKFVSTPDPGIIKHFFLSTNFFPKNIFYRLHFGK